MRKLFFVLLLVSLSLSFAGCTPTAQPQESIALPFDEYMDNVAAAVTEYLNHPVQEPINGHVFESSDLECLAPLTVATEGTGGYYVVLDPIKFYGSETETPFDEMRREMKEKYSFIVFYVNAGSSVNISVPLGEYEIYYAAGDTWYGESHLFGPETAYYKCNDTFVFVDNGAEYTGWTLQLIPTAYGNLDTDEISENEFPK